jgi:shikimate dehydrogenase
MLCISLSSNIGKFGTIVHNAGYSSLGLNWSYAACTTNNLKGSIQAIKTLGIRGCSISMPFKEDVMKYLDKIDTVAKKIGAVNTIVNNKGKLTGYNTDYIGAKESLKLLKPTKKHHFLVLGTGGASRSVLFALHDLGFTKITISGRNYIKAKKLADKFDSEVISWNEREKCTNEVLVNATPIGMYPNTRYSPVSKIYTKNLKYIMDIISNPIETRLIKNAKSLQIKNSNGLTMSLFQARAQFKLYTGLNLPMEVMKNAVSKYYKKKK